MGKDPVDLSSRDISIGDPFLVDITKLTVGYLDDADMEVVFHFSIRFVITTSYMWISN